MTRALSDDRLARRAAQGDERAFAAIYSRYHQDLYRFCLAIVGNAHDAQDALQNAIVKVLRALPGEKRRIELKPWLYRIAHNESVELLRKRRDSVEIDPELHGSGADLTDTAAARERLRRLLDDLGELPERQRAALVMRELAGLDFAQIGTAFDTSDAVARQTVYEARLSLRQMDEGREMSCATVMRELSDADGRVTRRREIKAHLRACPDCRAFRAGIAERHHDFAAIAPLPLAVSAGLLHGALGANGAAAATGAAGTGAGAAAGGSLAGTAAGGGLAGTAAVGAGKVAATSVVLKSAATVAVVAVVGAGAADRGGLIETPLPSSIGGAKSSGHAQPEEPASTAPAPGAPASPASSQSGSEPAATAGATEAGGGASDGKHESKDADSAASGKAHGDPAGKAPSSAPGGRPEGLPAASGHGQETAAAHSQEKSQGAPASKGSGKSKGNGHAKGRGKSKGRSPKKSRPPRNTHRGSRGGRSGGNPPPPPRDTSKQPQSQPAPTKQESTAPAEGSTEPAATEAP